MHKIFRSLDFNAKRDFKVLISEKTWICHADLISYWCDTPARKYMSGVNYGETLHPCIPCVVHKDDILDIANFVRRYELDMFDAYRKARMLLHKAETLHSFKHKKAFQVKDLGSSKQH